MLESQAIAELARTRWLERPNAGVRGDEHRSVTQHIVEYANLAYGLFIAVEKSL